MLLKRGCLVLLLMVLTIGIPTFAEASKEIASAADRDQRLVAVALTVFNFTAEQMKQKGAPLDWFVMWPAIARANGLAVSRKAPHPHAAVSFYDFMISDGQEILAKRDFTITSQKIQTPFSKTPLKLIDPAIVLDENQKCSHLYSEIITKQSK